MAYPKNPKNKSGIFYDTEDHPAISYPINLLKKNTGATNRKIAEHFGNPGNSGVAKVYQRFSKQLSINPSLQNKIEKIEQELSPVWG